MDASSRALTGAMFSIGLGTITSIHGIAHHLIGALHKSGFFSWKVFSIQPFHGVPRLRGDMFANVMMLVMLRPTISELSKAHKSHDMPWMSDTELPR